MKKHLLIATLVISALASFAANAGTWKKNNTGWWYDYGNGTYPASTWDWIDGNNDGVAECYYFNKKGYLLVDTVSPDGYEVNSNGAWVDNGRVQTKNVARTTNTNSTTTRRLTDSQALDAFENYLDEEWPTIKDLRENGNCACWALASSDDNQIVIAFRSYTGASASYYIDRYTGETLYRFERLLDGTPVENPFEKMNIWDYVY
ncbi:hypothetical protein SAMN05216349_11924 [Oribacterium sp. KHPX15]|uniref:hypothetical protein n=1 Tax=Oribacterium sp. KHPX15 TaxID=1855342 RepID=UPI00089AE0C6|nr:hypothetical protein [Oribacterium sp. KHPX15]SEA61762.1 hypothetical protein SAMN05216349_11924 [Oribacterium sp. KHPX15]